MPGRQRARRVAPPGCTGELSTFGMVDLRNNLNESCRNIFGRTCKFFARNRPCCATRVARLDKPCEVCRNRERGRLQGLRQAVVLGWIGHFDAVIGDGRAV